MKRLFFLAIPFASLAVTSAARAQVHYDVGLQAGASKHFLTSIPANSSDASIGPVATLSAHAAVIPMLRAGAYLGFEMSPISGAPARRLYSGGLHLRFLPPFLRNPCTYTWIGAGLGYVSVYAPSFTTTLQDANGARTREALFDGAPGHYFELPLSFGVARKWHAPWHVFAELGMRLGFGASGAYYDGRPGHAVGIPDLAALPAGNETFTLALSVGILLDQ